MWAWEREFFTIASEFCDNMGTSWFTSGTWRKSWFTTNFGTNPKRRTSDSLIHPLQAESVMKKTRWWSPAYISVVKNISFLRKNGVFYHETAIFGSKSWIWGCFFQQCWNSTNQWITTFMHHVMDPRYGVSKPAWLLIHVNVFRIHVGVSINGRTPLSLDGLFKGKSNL